MEVRETAACGISEREFAIDLGEDELQNMREFVEGALEAKCLDEEVGQGIIGALSEAERETSVSLELLETEIVQLFKGLQAAQAADAEHSEVFADDLFAAIEQIVGSALHDDD